MRNSTRKSIVVTGATRGLGRALVECWIEEGHVIHGCGRTAAEIRRLAEAYPLPCTFAAVDVANDGGVFDWAHQVISEHGAPDLLVNNAGLMNDPAPLWDVPAKSFDAVIDVNVKGVANVIRHFVPAMIARGSGAIVNLSSGWGRSASPEVAPYVASKFAVEGLTKALAKELPKGLAAVAFNPGVVDTDMLRQCWGAEAGDHEEPREWATRAADFLLQLGEKYNGQSVAMT